MCRNWKVVQFNDHFERVGSDKYSVAQCEQTFERVGSDKYSLTLCEQATSKTSKWTDMEI